MDSFEKTGERASGANLIEPIHAFREHAAHGVFPPYRADHLAHQQIANFVRVRVRPGVDIGPYRNTRLHEGYVRQHRSDRFIGWFHVVSMKGAGNGQSNRSAASRGGQPLDLLAGDAWSGNDQVAGTKIIGDSQCPGWTSAV